MQEILKSIGGSMKAEVAWNVCRICMHENNLQSIYGKDENDLVISDKIMQCADITINHDSNMPDKICSNCRNQLDAAFIFRTQCKQSDRILTELLEKYLSVDEETKIVLLANETIERDSENVSIIAEENEDLQHEVETLEDEIEDETVDSNSNQQVEIKIEFANSLMENQEKSTTNSKRKHILRHKNFKMKRKSQDCNDEDIIDYNATKVKNEFKKSRRLHICEFCGNIYRYKSTLDTHMRRHTNEKPYSCEICGRSFAVNGRLTCHMRTHTGQKPYECRFCHRKYADVGARQVHERTHTGERPFKCNVCDKTFTYSSVLQKHKLIHTDEKQYSCDHCDKHFRFRYHLTAHLSTARHQEKANESIDIEENKILKPKARKN